MEVMFRCCRVGRADFSGTVQTIRKLKRGSLIRAPVRRIYRGKGGGISVFTTPQSAEVFVASLHEKERVLLREALRINDQEGENLGKLT